MRVFNNFISAVLAGAMVSIGGTIFLSCDNRYIGAMLFSVGLLTVVTFGLNLYTGKAGYYAERGLENPITLLYLGISWLGNLVGTVVTALTLRMTRIYDSIAASGRLEAVVSAKVNDSLFSVFLLATMCGILIFISVDVYKRAKDGVVGVVAIVICVMVFILVGFEHCVANMFYFTFAGVWSPMVVLKILLMSVGNGLGAVVFPLWRRMAEKSSTKS